MKIPKATYCKNCYFASDVNSVRSCEFGIVEAIKDYKSVEIKDNYYYLNNYICKYGISTRIYETELKDKNIDVKQEKILQNIPKYILYIYIDVADDIEAICNNIQKLTIPPVKIKLALNYLVEDKKIYDSCKTILSNKYDWKIHKFLEYNEQDKMLATTIINDDITSYCNYIWILNSTLLDYVTRFGLENNINFILNIKQPDSMLFHTKQSEDLFYGLFTSAHNILNLPKLFASTIGETIRTEFLNDIHYYD